MDKNNKQGFTLVELLAVLIILIIIIFLAIIKVRNSSVKTQEDSIKANAISYIKVVNNAAAEVDITTQSPLGDGFLTVSDLESLNIKVSGTKPDDGYVAMSNFEVTESCLTYGSYKITYQNGDYSAPVKGTCEVPQVNAEYACTKSEVIYHVTKDGKYKLEVWGAQGGGSQISSMANLGVGGKGGYSSGIINLTTSDTLYVYVGCEGRDSYKGIAVGGWNGGGASWSENTSDPAGGGGGATDIRINSNSLYARVIVAGGGGGGGEDYEVGGYGGGTTGGGNKAGSQTAGSNGAVFGFGANTPYDGGAGGGGWYGGGTAGGSQTLPTGDSGSDADGGSGGSGFVYTSSSTLPEGYLLDETYYLESPQIIAGNQSMPNKNGEGNVTGNERGGYAKITFIE